MLCCSCWFGEDGLRKSSDTRTAQVMGVNVMNQASTNVCASCQGCRHEKILVWLNVEILQGLFLRGGM